MNPRDRLALNRILSPQLPLPEFLKLAADRSPDVVFLDTGLPGMDGHEVARRLRLLPGLQRALVVGLSGDVQARVDRGVDLLA